MALCFGKRNSCAACQPTQFRRFPVHRLNGYMHKVPACFVNFQEYLTNAKKYGYIKIVSIQMFRIKYICMEVTMYVMGVDVGSASSKAIILENGEKILASAVVQAGTGTSGPVRVLEQVFAESGLNRADMAYVVATGYGRLRFEGADKQISEISCHAKGVHFLVPTARTIIDIGGQDAKAIRLDQNGNVKQFFMNDKCAAGTGRFLEVMARVLETDLDSMAELSSHADAPASISSTCTVFAESEVISQLSRGVSRENIIAGVHDSVAVKAVGLLLRGGVEDTVVMTGGVARNEGVVKAIAKELGHEVVVCPNPQMAGALGAALFAHAEALKQRDRELHETKI